MSSSPYAAHETKRVPTELLDIAEDGTFIGYASLFNRIDLWRDLVRPGAFAETLRKRGASGVKMLWQHDAAQPIGAWLSILEDERGLKVRGRLNKHVARAREVLALMREGAIDGLSIGFRAGKARVDPKSGVRNLISIDLWEISIVTFPMLPEARVSAVKQRDPSGLAASIRRAACAFQ